MEYDNIEFEYINHFIEKYDSQLAATFFCFLLSLIAYYLTVYGISASKRMFFDAGLKGRDMGRKETIELPEAMGTISGVFYIVVLITFVAVFYFLEPIFGENFNIFNKHMLTNYLAGLLSICCMIFLGFADDVLNLRWRHKLIFPFFASLPLIIVLIINKSSTGMVVPFFANFIFGDFIELGSLYYIFVICLTIFFSNSINILSGINGLEVAQSIIISIAIIIYSIIEIIAGNYQSLLSLYISVPFLAVSLALFSFNKYPATVFVGDSYCYFAGMTFAVTGVLGNCSKTVLLFFIPQLINFVISLPQLLKLYPCPRHRLPFVNYDNGLRLPSTTSFKISSLDISGCLVVGSMARFGFADITSKTSSMQYTAKADNMTLLNVFLRKFGPMTESDLLKLLIKFQVIARLNY